MAVKAQVHTGGRGKAGGIKLAQSPDDAREAASDSRHGHQRPHRQQGAGRARRCEIAPRVLSRRHSRSAATGRCLVMASAEGGVDIEEVARETARRRSSAQADPLLGLAGRTRRAKSASRSGLPADKVGRLRRHRPDALQRLYRGRRDAGRDQPADPHRGRQWLALDSKMSFDDNALFRHPGIEELRDMEEENATESKRAAAASPSSSSMATSAASSTAPAWRWRRWTPSSSTAASRPTSSMSAAEPAPTRLPRRSPW